MTLEHDAAARIRTPDQRLRVFVSSTLRELETERRAARAAIERLRLAPVMFELGARPHPPRDLYRAYLEQSDVFVGIYGESYGWVAPGEEISGLEDEYRLAPAGMPKLIYLLADAHREPRLDTLIARIRSDDTASYQRYTSTAELAELIEADLATLLAERFDATRFGAQRGPAEPSVTHPAPVPVAFSRLIGRAEEVAEISTLLQDPDIRLVTLVGPGGVGKSRLSIEVAESCRTAFADGTVFIALENVLEPELLFPTIADALGIRDTGEAPITQRLAIALEGRRMLMILDNFEQLATAAPLLVDLYSLAPRATFLVTSRVVLRVRGERVYEVAPLLATDPEAPDSIVRAARSPAVELFVERGRAVKPDFDLEQTNATAVVGICQALDGIPLAIELAAARLRVLTPAAILTRLDRRLQLLVDSSRDLPDRQRTLRATIEWSTDLLGSREREMLFDLGVFSPGFTLDAIDAIGAGRSWDGFALDCLAQLIDSSLVSQSDQEGFPVFSLLATVREYAVERLAAAGDERTVRDAHAAYYTDLAVRVAADLRGPGQREAARRLDLERGNARGAIRHLVAVGDGDASTEIAWRLYLYWWLRGYFYELHLWMRELLDGDHELTPHARAVATFYVLWSEMWRAESAGVAEGLAALIDEFAAMRDPLGVAMARATTGLARASLRGPGIPQAIEDLTTAAAEFEALGHTWGQVLSLVGLGRVAWMLGDSEGAARHFSEACDAARLGDPFTLSVAIHHVARARLFAHDVDDALRLFAESMDISLSLDHDEGVAYAIEGISAIAALRGDLEGAGLLAGSAERIRQRITMFDAEAFVFHTRYLREAATGPDATAAAEAAIARGRELSIRESVEYAHQVLSAS